MIFKEDQMEPSTTCPRCHREHQESAGNDITCITCGTVFRRIEEIGEPNEIASPNDDGIDEGELQENTLKNIQKFRRIQLIKTPIIHQVLRGRSEEENSRMSRPLHEMRIGRTGELRYEKSISTHTGDRRASQYPITNSSNRQPVYYVDATRTGDRRASQYPITNSSNRRPVYSVNAARTRDRGSSQYHIPDSSNRPPTYYSMRTGDAEGPVLEYERRTRNARRQASKAVYHYYQ
ncbi:hypothetical protein N7454_002174 [Penicillium verhagenii]|nr:hypothetical protein N7454_002174 [Penicillium verhagenii]